MGKIKKISNTMITGLLLLLLCLGCQKVQYISLWEKHCGACHDGKTVLNGKVVMDKAQIREKYRSPDDFANACGKTPMCMNIVKHDKKLLREVGRELEIKNAADK